MSLIKSSLMLIIATMVLGSLPAAACDTPAEEQADNPFFQEWTTPFGVPPFDQIRDEHFLPAFQEAFRLRRQEVEAITANPEPPTLANTIEALEHSGALLTRVRGVFINLVEAETSDELQQIAQQVAGQQSALNDEIYLNQALYARIKAVSEQCRQLDLMPEQQRLLEATYRRFVRGGAEVAESDRDRFRAINQELSGLVVQFAQNLRAATNAYQLVIEEEQDLSGLPATVVAAAAEAAAAAGLDDRWLFTLQSPSIWPFLTFADDRELRQQILTAYLDRCRSGEYDNRSILTRIAARRAEKARLLGYPTWAHYVLEERMAKTPQRVDDLLRQLWQPALARAKEEAAVLQERIDRDGHSFKLAPWDWRYYAEKVKQERYNVDQEEVRSYFELGNVIRGAFWVTEQLWGLSFVERRDLPTYHDEVRAYEVRDADGAHLGVLLVDYHPRPSKRGGAWMEFFRWQEVRGGHDIRPIVVNVGNFSRPSGDVPALLRLEEVETLFHELGHALHGLLSRCHYRSLSGTEVPRDFVELPSQLMENWVLEPEVLKVYARHYQTGEVLSDELISKIERTRTFNQGFRTVEFLAAALLDMRWHTVTEAEVEAAADAAAFERQVLDEIGLIPEIPVRYRSPYFRHIFGKAENDSYAAGYYGYVWSEVLDADAYQSFTENGIFDDATATSYRRHILARGSTEEAMTMYKRFRGAEPSVEPLLERRGLK